jgi:hypothetical protein
VGGDLGGLNLTYARGLGNSRKPEDELIKPGTALQLSRVCLSIVRCLRGY